MNQARAQNPKAQRRARPRPGKRPSVNPVSEVQAETTSRVRRRPVKQIAPRSQPQPQPRRAPVAPSLVEDLHTPASYVVKEENDVRDVQPLKTEFFNTINNVKALTVRDPEKSVRINARETLAQARGYDRDDLFAVAEIGYHYLFSGGVTLALTIYEGLTAVAPNEPYFALGLGLIHDQIGNMDESHAWYKRAAQLDPSDGRPYVNRAELCLSSGNFRKARDLLSRGLKRASLRHDAALEKKASALLNHIERSM